MNDIIEKAKSWLTEAFDNQTQQEIQRYKENRIACYFIYR